MLVTDKKIVLASQSPRRKELLSLIFNKFDIIPSTDEESINYALEPHKIVEELAEQKAKSVYNKLVDKSSVVIGSDTIVYCNNKILLKPKDEQDAKEMLTLLSNNTHSVFTGVSIVTENKTETFYCETKVKFNELSHGDITKYIKTHEPMDKAGAYGIQGYGAVFIEKIDGNYHSVMGLPVSMLYNKIQEFL